jgi:hypothetical protein
MSSLATTSCGSGLCACVSAEGVKSSAFAADELAQGSALNDLAVPDRAAVRINGIELKLGTGQETDIVSPSYCGKKLSHWDCWLRRLGTSRRK